MDVRDLPGGDPRPRDGGPVVVHVMTIAQSLFFLAGQAPWMRERCGVRVHAIASPGPALARFGRNEGVEVHAVPMTRRITPLRDVVALWRLWRLLRRIRPAIVHAHTPKAGLLGMVAARLAGTQVRIYHLRGLPLVTATGARRRLYRLTERGSCALATRVLSVSHSVRRIVIDEGLCEPEKIRVLLGGSGNGVDATRHYVPASAEARRRVRAEQGLPDDAFVIGFLGRLVRDKGIVELAAAWRRIRDADERAHLLFVGGDEFDPIARDVVALRSDPRVRFAGYVDDTSSIYGAMDVVALPTWREGLSNVALEAAAMELPVVGAAVPGVVDAVEDGVTGTLVPARDADALAASILRYARDPALRRAHGEAGRRRVLAEFRREAIWDALAQEYLDLLASTPAARPAPDASRAARGIPR